MARYRKTAPTHAGPNAYHPESLIFWSLILLLRTLIF
jgi:hypothetical protein